MRFFQSRPRFSLASLSLALACFVASPAFAALEAPLAQTEANSALKVGVVNFRKCVESSKIGKHHQNSFESMKTQMETLLQQKEKALNEISVKLSDEDYVDGLTKDASNELKHKYRALAQEFTQAQQQFMQTLQQANLRIVQLLTDDVSQAANEIAKAKGLDVVFNEEAAFYYKPALDLSDAVIAKLDETFEVEMKRKEGSKETPNSESSTPAAFRPLSK